jgi:hypothetical protein
MPVYIKKWYLTEINTFYDYYKKCAYAEEILWLKNCAVYLNCHFAHGKTKMCENACLLSPNKGLYAVTSQSDQSMWIQIHSEVGWHWFAALGRKTF